MFRVAGSLRGRPVLVRWLDAGRGLPARLDGDAEARLDVEQAIADGAQVAPTPTGPRMTAAIDQPEVALVTIASVLDDDVEIFVAGDAPEIPGLGVPDGAVA